MNSNVHRPTFFMGYSIHLHGAFLPSSYLPNLSATSSSVCAKPMYDIATIHQRRTNDLVTLFYTVVSNGYSNPCDS